MTDSIAFTGAHPKKMVLTGQHAESWIGCQQSKAEKASWLLLEYFLECRTFFWKHFEGKDVKVYKRRQEEVVFPLDSRDSQGIHFTEDLDMDSMHQEQPP